MAKEIQPWSPFRELDHFRRNFDEMFDRLLGSWMPGEAMRAMTEPAVEAFVDNGRLIVRVELPGVDPKNVSVTVSGDTLEIRGKREHAHEEKSRNYLYREISYGSFERSVALPKGVDPDQVKASFKHGVLELAIPVPKELTPRKVPVTVEGGEKQQKLP